VPNFFSDANQNPLNYFTTHELVFWTAADHVDVTSTIYLSWSFEINFRISCETLAYKLLQNASVHSRLYIIHIILNMLLYLLITYCLVQQRVPITSSQSWRTVGHLARPSTECSW